jgi:ABC-type nitrate/sulfonate/bicarbonate transport system substrate-binding protein
MMTRSQAAALLFAGAAAAATRRAAFAQAAAAPVRLAIVNGENSAEAYYGADMGFFAKAGLDVQIQAMQSGNALAAALASGATDIAYLTIDVLAAVRQKGIPITAIAPAAEHIAPATSQIAGIVVPVSSPAKLAKDLNGKIVATTALHSFAETAPRVWIDQNGGDSSTIKFVELPYSSMVAALESGRIDAAWMAEPFLAVAEKTNRVLAFGFDAVAKHFLLAAWATTPQWAHDHADVVARFASAMHDCAVWANKNPAKSADILVKYLKIDPAAIATMVRSHYAERLTPDIIQPMIDVSAKYNGFASFPARDLIYTPGR